VLPARKVAFVSPLWTALVHRLVRGALSYADTRSHATVRDFRITRAMRASSATGDTLNQLRAWNPDGVLSFLENQELEKLLGLLPRPCPVVSMSAVQLRPGVAVVSGSFSAQVEAVDRHFRQQGLRSLALLLLESEQEMETTAVEAFKRIVRPADPAQATFVEVVDPDLLDDPDARVSPVPRRLEEWFRALPRPTGVFCPQSGGGGYIIRVCHALGLRVPQDVAVIGADDADLSLASNPTLTSVIPVGEQIGFEAMRILDQMMAGRPGPKDRVRLDAVDLHVRDSTGLQRAHVCDIAAAVAYINQRAGGGLSVAQVLKATQQVSSKTFHTHFKAATGQTPGEAIRRRQFEEARRLLAESELSVTLVAEKSGFGSSSDFARRFRALEGKSPLEYRMQARRRTGGS
jgi:LacI family transcriptional regulator